MVHDDGAAYEGGRKTPDKELARFSVVFDPDAKDMI